MDGWLRQPDGLNCLRFHRDPIDPPQDQETSTARSGGQRVEGADQGGLETRRAPVVTDAVLHCKASTIQRASAMPNWPKRWDH